MSTSNYVGGTSDMETKVNSEKQGREEGKTDNLRVAQEVEEYVVYHDTQQNVFYKQYKLPFGAKEG